MRFAKHALLMAFGVTLVVATGCEQKGESAGSKTDSHETSAKTTEPSELVFAFQPQENPQSLAPDADRMAAYMTEKVGITSKVFLPTSYSSVVEALRSGNADVAYFSGWPYLVAKRKADVELLVVEERDGKPFYQSRWYVDAKSGIESVADLKGKKVAFTSPTSTCGYLFPLAEVIDQGAMKKGGDPKTFFGEVVYAGGYQQALEALVHGRVDAAAGADYAFELYLSEEERANVNILSEQGPVPTHGVAVRASLPEEVKASIEQAFLDLNESKNAELLESLYGAQKLVSRDGDEHVAALKSALAKVGRQHEDLEGFGAGSGSGHHHEAGDGSGSGDHHEKGEGEGSGSGHHHEKGEGEGSGSARHHHSE